MNRNSQLFDDRIAEWLEEDPLQAPPQLLQTVLAAVPSVPQRRAGLAWAPAALPRVWQLAAAVVLVLALGFMALQVIHPPSVAPSQSPSATTGPSTTTVEPGPTASVVAPSVSPVAGAPVPDELIGAWHHSAPGWWWFLRAGDPECTQAVRTEFDCVAWQRGTTAREIGIATFSSSVLTVRWKSGYCNGLTANYTVVLTGDSLNLIERPGGCEGGDLALTRAGTGSAPTAPPPPTP